MKVAFLDAEHAAFRTRTRDFLTAEILPHAPDWERDCCIPAKAWRALGDAGMLALDHRGSGFLMSAVFLEELGALGYAGIRAAVGVHAFMAASYLELFGTYEQREKFLAPMRRGESVAALALTEAASGSDLRRLQTRATQHPDGGFTVDGEKHYVANGTVADLIVTLVGTGRDGAAGGLAGASLLLVDAADPGVARQPQPMLGWRSAGICRLEFRNAAVPGDRLVGRRDRALLHLVRALDFERLVAGLLAVGGVRHCLDLLGRFARGHRVRDAPLSANQAVRHRLAELETEYELVRHYAHHAAWLHSTGALDTRTASIVKLRATELAVSAAQTCLQYHGARGYLDESTAARLYRDAMGGTIAAGASELLRDLIFEDGEAARYTAR